MLHDVPERPDLDLAVGPHRGHQAPPLANVHRTHPAPHVVELGVGLFAAKGWNKVRKMQSTELEKTVCMWLNSLFLRYVDVAALAHSDGKLEPSQGELTPLARTSVADRLSAFSEGEFS